MKNQLLLLILYMLNNGFLFPQPVDQRNIIAANGISEEREYKRVFQNGQPTSDSLLMSVYTFNSKGRSTTDVIYNVLGQSPITYQNEYLHDTLPVKMTSIREGHTRHGEAYYEYDAQGKLVKFSSYPEPMPGASDTLITYHVFDSLNHLMNTYLDEGKGKTLWSKHEYYASGKVKRQYYYFTRKGQASIEIKEFEYNSIGQVARTYQINGEKRMLVAENNYNDVGQLISKLDVNRHRLTKYFGLIPYHVKKTEKGITTYYYDERGLLTNEEKQVNGKLTEQRFYRYAK